MSVFPAVFQFSPGCDRVMAAVQWTGSTLTGLPEKSYQFWELVFDCLTGDLLEPNGVYMNSDRIGISHGVSAHGGAAPSVGYGSTFCETRDSLLAIPGVSSAG